MNIAGEVLLDQYRGNGQLWPEITDVEVEFDLPPFLLWAVASRETNMARPYAEGQVHADGHGWGLFGADDRWNNLDLPHFASDVEEQARLAARTLRANYERLGIWVDAVNAYGPAWARPDYGVDVIERAAYLEAHSGGITLEHRIIPRAEWGATQTSGMVPASYPMGAVWLHHSDTVPTDDPAADIRLLQQIGFERGFSDVSYTFALHPDGSILEGRELRYVGAHTYGNNSTSLAFVLIGNYDDTAPTDEQIASARWLRDRLIAEAYLIPGTYPTGGHQDAPGNSTGCPGAMAEARLDLFRAPQTEVPATPPTPPEEPDVAKIAYPLEVRSGQKRKLPIVAIGGGFGWARASVTFASAGVDVRRAIVGPNERPIAGLAPEGVETGRHFEGRGYVDLQPGDEWIEVQLARSPAGALDLYVEASDA